MKSGKLAALLLALCLILTGNANAVEKTTVEPMYDDMKPNADAKRLSDGSNPVEQKAVETVYDDEKDNSVEQKAAGPVYDPKAEEMYREAIALKEKGDYEASLEILQKLVKAYQGTDKYEIALLDVLVEQSHELKERGNTAWKLKVRGVGLKIKEMYDNNIENSDYWVVYARFSWLVEAKKETHITKAIKKAFYYKPNNPEAYITNADYNFECARDYHVDTTPKYGMGHIEEGELPLNRSNLAKTAKNSYETALASPVSDARKSYILLKMGDLEALVFRNRTAAAGYWERASQLEPDGKYSRIAGQRLNNKL